MFQPDQGFGPRKWLFRIGLAIVCIVVLGQFFPNGETYTFLIGKFAVPVAIIAFLAWRLYHKFSRRGDP